ncbi:hypothetical protein QJQ45_029816 [Haematococcus lacustris]|nr:hypothetical protein QJQ45_029816 [Haematococcus lacustris]
MVKQTAVKRSSHISVSRCVSSEQGAPTTSARSGANSHLALDARRRAGPQPPRASSKGGLGSSHGVQHHIRAKHASSGASGASPPAAAAAAAVAVAVRETTAAEEEEEEEEEGGVGQVANNVVPAGGLDWLSHLARARALVLDSAYRPIHVVSWHKAVNMDVGTRASVLEYYPPDLYAVSGRGKHLLPAVVRVDTYVDLHELCQRVTCTRRNVMARDKFCCQYCGSNRELTLDHIVPVCKGGKNSWVNLVTACMSCNQRKGSKLLHQMGWHLKTKPRVLAIKAAASVATVGVEANLDARLA